MNLQLLTQLSLATAERYSCTIYTNHEIQHDKLLLVSILSQSFPVIRIIYLIIVWGYTIYYII